MDIITPRRDFILAVFVPVFGLVVFLAQTIVETLIFGALLRLLDPGALFVATIIFSFAETIPLKNSSPSVF